MAIKEVFVSYFWAKDGETGYGNIVLDLNKKLNASRIDIIRKKIIEENLLDNCIILFFKEL